MTALITVQGGLTAAPELRYSQNGVAICSGTIASTDRYLDRQTNEWRDGKKLFLRWTAFKELAENIAASNLDRGAQVTISGKLHTREYEHEGTKRTVTELEVTDFSTSVRRATVTVVKNAPKNQGNAQQSAPAEEPWATPGSGGADAWAAPGAYGDDTPF